MLLTSNERLPTGSPSSPLVSYFAHLRMWEEISVLVKSYNCTLSVYIDDVAISGDRVPKVLLDRVKKMLNKYGLKSKKAKEKHYSQGNAEITGVILCNDGSLCVPRRQHKKMHELRQSINLTDDEYEGHSLSLQLHGCKVQKAQVENFLGQS